MKQIMQTALELTQSIKVDLQAQQIASRGQLNLGVSASSGPPQAEQFHHQGASQVGQHNQARIQQNMTTKLLQRMDELLARQAEFQLQFDGSSCLEWLYFRKRFESLCNDGGYNNLQRVVKLDEFLKEPARSYVDVALKAADDPEQVLSILDRIYGRSELVQAEIDQKVAVVPEVHDLIGFGNFVCAVKNISLVVSFVTGLVHDVRQILEKLVGKLPMYLVVSFCEYCARQGISEGSERLSDLSQWTDTLSRMTSFMRINEKKNYK
jgi:hypothetical protein